MEIRTYKKSNILLAFTALFLIVLPSCKKFVDISTPPDAVGTDGAFTDSGTATSVVLGIYSGVASGTQRNGANSVVYLSGVYGAMSADEGYYLTNTTFDDFENNTLSAGGATTTYWNALYTRIARANYAIAGLSNAGHLPEGVRNQLLGEAKFWRAWLYFYLVNFFGDVPLVLTTDALSDALLPRSPVTAVYVQILTDLTEAKNLLGTNYPTTERARVNKSVASAFLARVYFYLQDWAAAESEATTIIDNSLYSLEPDPDNVFLKTSSETIWQISLAGTSTPATVFGDQFIPAATTPAFVLYDTLTNTFEANDQRFAKWTKPIVYESKTYYYPYKYKLRVATEGNEYPVLIRLAEMYLIRAEARAQQNDIPGAQEDLNKIRTRAGLPNTTASTEEQLLAALAHERWVELFTETSDRWFNLKRLDKATEVLSLIKPSWQSFQQLYPIPQSSMTSNPNLGDNPGY